MDLRSFIDTAFPPPKIEEKIAIEVPKESLWRWFVEEERFLEWNRDARSLRWEGDGRVGEARFRRLLGGDRRMGVRIESRLAPGGGGEALWVFSLRQDGAAYPLSDSEISYVLAPAGNGTILSLSAWFGPWPFPIRRVYGALATEWFMAGAFRLKERAEGAPR